ncbi:ATP-dependent Clp protease (apicoplast) [Babesia microti strain RI]|uniref:ATP-dependent Clp protease n=1 Tax=Babesia microti (strain RI) TaxID=1133968 RepID=A0A068W693_BABMR|nr:ATP-dependent Clp protease [Babesia microti strain RI]CDR32607.1 ATP-dependent Clp protease [Babesia microti strain RI]|eukprot:YP_009363176.1 ATP-dependent Clp protease (apicoplast) [Babesia microti strain RI]
MNYYFNLNNYNYINFFNYKNKLLDFRNFDYYLKFNLFKYINKCLYLQKIYKDIIFNNIKFNIFNNILLNLNFNYIYNKLFNINITEIDRFDLNNIYIKDLNKLFINDNNYCIDIKNYKEFYFINYYLVLYEIYYNNIIFLIQCNTNNSDNYNKFLDIYNIINLFIKDNKFIKYIICSNYNIIISKINNIYNNKFYKKLKINNYTNNINYFLLNKIIINKINNINIFNNFIFNDLLKNNYNNNFLILNNINFNNNLYHYNKINIFNNYIKLNNIINFNNIINTFKENKKFDKYISNFIFGQENQLHKLSTVDINKIFSKKEINSIKPIGSWIICGPSGTGKTELAKIISKLLYNNKLKFIKFDMSEFMDKYTVSRLIGAPPGYLGYEKGGELTNFVNENKNSIILFDEAEKANKYIYDILLQVLDEGVLTDSKGIKVFFNKSILIFTSNIGSSICKNNKFKFNNIIFKNVIKELKKFFRIEFLNRIDDILIFNYLDLFSIYKLMDKFLFNISKFCININKIKLFLSLIFNKNNTNIRKIIRILDNNIINKIYNFENNNISIDICGKSLVYKNNI